MIKTALIYHKIKPMPAWSSLCQCSQILLNLKFVYLKPQVFPFMMQLLYPCALSLSMLDSLLLGILEMDEVKLFGFKSSFKVRDLFL